MVVLLSKPSDEDLDDTSVADALMVELTQLFRSRLPDLIERMLDDGGVSANAEILDKCLRDTVQALEKTTKTDATMYRPTWSVSLPALVVLIQCVHVSRSPTLPLIVARSVGTLLEIRNEAPAGSPSQHAVEAAFMSLAQGVGIEDCWGWIQWQPSKTPSSKGEY